MPWMEDRTGLLLLGQHIRKCREWRDAAVEVATTIKAAV